MHMLSPAFGGGENNNNNNNNLYHRAVLKLRSLQLRFELGFDLTHVEDLPTFLLEQHLFLVCRIVRMPLYILEKLFMSTDLPDVGID